MKSVHKKFSILILVAALLIGFVVAADKIEVYDYDGYGLRHKINYSLFDAINFTGTNINISNQLDVGGKVFFPEFLSIGNPCNPSLQGNGNLCVSGTAAFNGTITGFTPENGIGLSSLGANQIENQFFTNGSGILSLSDKTLCDITNPFSEDTERFFGFNLFSPAGLNEGALFIIEDFINSSCMSVNVANYGNDTSTYTNLSYILAIKPMFSTTDKDNIFVKIGSFDDSTFDIDIPEANGDNKFKISSLVGSMAEIFNIFTNANASDVVNLDSFIFSEVDNNDSVHTNIRAVGDLENFNSGEYTGVDVDLINPDPSMSTTGIKISSNFENVLEISEEKNLSKGYYDSTTAITNITDELVTLSIATNIFEENSSILYLGNAINFTRLKISLDVRGSDGIDPIYYYCNSESNWVQFNNSFSDGTNGFSQSGIINFLNPSDRGTCNKQINGTIFSDSNNYTYIAIQRSNPVILTTPSISSADIALDSSRIFIGNGDTVSGAPNTFWISNEELLQEGEPSFGVLSKDSNGNSRVNLWIVSRQNNSGGGLFNSFGVFPDNDLSDKTNLTEISNLRQRWLNYGITPRLNYFSGLNQTSMASLFGFEGQQLILHNDLGNGFLSVEGDADFSLAGNDMNLFNGSLTIQDPVTFEQGFNEGDNVTILTADFTGSISPFQNLQADVGNWFVTTNSLCDSGTCAESTGAGAGNIFMQANFSTLDTNETTINFVYSLLDLVGGSTFNVYVNNNNGSGDVLILTDAGSETLNQQSINLNSSFFNQSVISIEFECDATSASRLCFVDTVKVNGTFTTNSATNVTGNKLQICAGDAIKDANGECSRALIYDVENDLWRFNGAVNVTGSGGGVSGSGTTNTIAKWFSTSSLGNSILTDDGSNVSISGELNVAGSITSLDWGNVSGSQINNDLNWINQSQANASGDLRWILQSEEGNLNVNSSDYWDTYNSVNTTQFENNGGVLSIVLSWFSTEFDSLFAAKTTDDLTEGTTNLYDNQSWNESHANDIFLRNDGDNGTGTYNFNGGWLSNGLSIIGGNIYAQAGYFYNLTAIDVQSLKINGSLIPQDGFSNTFDLGSSTLKWKDLFIGNGGYFNNEVGIGTTTPAEALEVNGNVRIVDSFTAGENLTEGDLVYYKSDGKFWKTNVSSENSSKGLLAIATGNVTVNTTGSFMLRGTYTTTGLTTADVLFLSTTVGNWNSTSPISSGQIVRIIGYSLSSTELYFDPDKTYVEIA